MSEIFEQIKEVQDEGKRLANYYLDKGWVLLDIQPGSRTGRFPSENPTGFQFYVRKDPVYVVGRPGFVDPCDPFNPRREEPREEEQP